MYVFVYEFDSKKLISLENCFSAELCCARVLVFFFDNSIQYYPVQFHNRDHFHSKVQHNVFKDLNNFSIFRKHEEKCLCRVFESTKTMSIATKFRVCEPLVFPNFCILLPTHRSSVYHHFQIRYCRAVTNERI